MADNKHIPQGYKDSSLGIIPEDWEVKMLREFSEISSGATPSRNKEEFWNGNIPWVTTTLLNDSKIWSTEETISEEGLKKSATRLLPPGTILMAMYGQGKTRGFVSILMIAATTNQACAAISLNDHSNYYIFYQLQYRYDQIRNLSNDGNQKNLSLGIIGQIEIPIPPLSIQLRIAEILSCWDEAIDKQTQLIEKLEIRKRGLMHQLLTWEGKGWEDVKMGDLFERVTRRNSEGNTNVVTISAQRGFIKQTEFFSKSIASEQTDNYSLVWEGEFCYNKSYSNGYPWGAIKRLNEFEKAVVTTLYICFKIKDNNKASGDFFEHFFEAKKLNKGLAQIAHEGGRAHGLLNVTPSDFFSLRIIIPDLSEQERIANILKSLDKEINLLRIRGERINEQKLGLMQQLLTGKKRVKTIN